VAVLTSGFRGLRIDLSDPGRIGNSRTLGEAIFTSWVLAFELLSMVLLAALIGAIVVSGRVRERDRPGDVRGSET
jgi:NADH:ubiquinone oxidoreductase subunit 6 (subunit J)